MDRQMSATSFSSRPPERWNEESSGRHVKGRKQGQHSDCFLYDKSPERDWDPREKTRQKRPFTSRASVCLLSSVSAELPQMSKSK